jgi:hypothetical protein
MNKVDCCLSYDSFWTIPKCNLHLITIQQVPHALLKAIVSSMLQKHLQRDPQCTPAIWHASQSQSQGTSYLQSVVVPSRLGVQWAWHALIGADHLALLFCILQGSWGSCSWCHIRAVYPGWDTWSTLCRTPWVHKGVLSLYCFCLWLPCRKRDVGANTITRRVSWETHYSWTKKIWLL